MPEVVQQKLRGAPVAPRCDAGCLRRKLEFEYTPLAPSGAALLLCRPCFLKVKDGARWGRPRA